MFLPAFELTVYFLMLEVLLYPHVIACEKKGSNAKLAKTQRTNEIPTTPPLYCGTPNRLRGLHMYMYEEPESK